jgi:hypothetical protein
MSPVVWWAAVDVGCGSGQLGGAAAVQGQKRTAADLGKKRSEFVFSFPCVFSALASHLRNEFFFSDLVVRLINLTLHKVTRGLIYSLHPKI